MGTENPRDHVNEEIPEPQASRSLKKTHKKHKKIINHRLRSKKNHQKENNSTKKAHDNQSSKSIRQKRQEYDVLSDDEDAYEGSGSGILITNEQTDLLNEKEKLCKYQETKLYMYVCGLNIQYTNHLVQYH